jgi:hypothetical protein
MGGVQVDPVGICARRFLQQVVSGSELWLTTAENDGGLGLRRRTINQRFRLGDSTSPASSGFNIRRVSRSAI